MHLGKTDGFDSFEEYRNVEVEFHTELINVARRYINKLGIVSLIGVFDIVKQEVIELEKATKKTFDTEEPQQEDIKFQGSDSFNKW